MKKNKQSNAATKKKALNVEEKVEETTEKVPKVASFDEEEQGFGGWLRSADGLETMKLFVIANSIVMLTTIVYPHIQTVYGILTDMFYGDYGYE